MFYKPKQEKDKEKSRGIHGVMCIIKWWCNKQSHQAQQCDEKNNVWKNKRKNKIKWHDEESVTIEMKK